MTLDPKKIGALPGFDDFDQLGRIPGFGDGPYEVRLDDVDVSDEVQSSQKIRLLFRAIK